MVSVLVALLLQAGSGRATSPLESAIAALEAGRAREALERLAPLVKAAPGNPQLLTVRGIAFKLAGDRAQALRSFRAALQTDPDYLPALEGAAELEYASGNADAPPRLQRVLKLAPSNATAHAMLGVLQFEAGRYAEAVKHFDSGSAALRGNPTSLWMYGQALYHVKRYGDAADAFEQLAASAPGREHVAFNIALCRFGEGRHAEVIAALKPQLGGPRPELAAIRLAASSYELEKQTREATALLQRAAELYPREELVYLDLANLCLEHAGYDLGIEVVSAGLKNVGPSARLHAMRAILYVQSGHTEMAEADFEAARQLSPESGYGQVGLSITMMETDRLDESITLLRQRLAANSKDPTGQFVLAQVLMKKGREPGTPEYDEAQAILRRVIAHSPGHAPAHTLLGKVLFARGEIKDSIWMLERALALEPRDRTATYQLMLAYRRLGDQEKAAAMQQRIREIIELDSKQEVERNRVRLVKAPERKRP